MLQVELNPGSPKHRITKRPLYLLHYGSNFVCLLLQMTILIAYFVLNTKLQYLDLWSVQISIKSVFIQE